MAPPRSQLPENKSSSNHIQNSTAKIWAKLGACWEKLSSCFEACGATTENYQAQAHRKSKNNLMMEEFDHFVGEEQKQLLEPRTRTSC